MIAATAPNGARLVDTVHLVTANEAHALKAAGVDGVAQYLGSVTAEGVAGITEAGLGFTPVTYADSWDAPKTVAELGALALPTGTVVWLDVEGLATTLGAPYVIGKINGWASAVSAAAFIPGLYVGANALLTSAELEALAVYRYWKSLSRVEDRSGALAEPAVGYCIEQRFPPNQVAAGVLVDFNMTGTDYRRRPLVWTVSDREAVTLPGRKSSGAVPRVQG